MVRPDFNKAASAKSNFSKFGGTPHTAAPKRFDSEQPPINSAPTLPLERSSRSPERSLQKGNHVRKVSGKVFGKVTMSERSSERQP